MAGGQDWHVRQVGDLSRSDAAFLAFPNGPAVAFDRQKRAMDVILASLMLLILAPLLISAALCIFLEFRGPVLFVQRRTGLGGRLIRVYKFRTMTVTEDGEGVRQACRLDERVTRLGRFLRRSSIDELPQLLNVIKGDMSLVGPRPHALAHDHYYSARVPRYGQRFRAKPGITGLAQVSGFRGEIRSLESMIDRVALDNAYIEDWSIRLDLAILIKTAAVAAFQSNAY